MNSTPTTSLDKQTPSPFLAWVVCLCAALFFAYELMQFHLLNAISAPLMKDLQINGTSFGMLGSTYLLADVIFLLPAGIILDRFSAKKVILSALFLCVTSTVGFAMAHNLFHASIAHFIAGIGNAFCFLSCIMLVSNWFPAQKRAFVIGVVVTMGMLGGVIAQAPFAYLAQICSWREALLINALGGAVIFVLIFFLVKDAPKALYNSVSKTPSISLSQLVSELKVCIFDKQTLLCGLYTALTNLPLMVIGAAWGSLFLSHVHGIHLSKASFIAGMICMGTIVGSSLAGYLSDNLGKRKPLMLLGAFLSLIVMCLILAIPTASFTTMTLLFFLLGLFSSTQVLGYPLITENAPKHLVGTCMSIAAVIIMGLAGVAQYFSGILIDLGWNGVMEAGSPLYQRSDYIRSFLIFPLGFIASLFALFYIKEGKKEHALG